MQCQKCNNELEVDSKFCAHCGAPVPESVIVQMKDEKPITKTKVFLLKTLAFFIAAFLTMIIKLILVAVGLLEFSADFMKGGILLLLALWMLLNGFFLKDAGKKKWGAVLLGAYLVLSFAFGYFYNHSDFGVEQQIIDLGSNTPKKIDENVELTSVKLNGNTVVMDYKLLNMDSIAIEADKLSELESTTKSDSCKDESFIKLFEHGKDIKMSFYGNDNNLIFDIQISKDDCSQNGNISNKVAPATESGTPVASETPVEEEVKQYSNKFSALWNDKKKQYDDPEKGIEYLTKIIDLKPNDSFYLNSRANVYDQMGKKKLALADYTRALTIEPDDTTILENRGYTYWELGKIKQAKADANKVCRLGNCEMKERFDLWEKEGNVP